MDNIPAARANRRAKANPFWLAFTACLAVLIAGGVIAALSLHGVAMTAPEAPAEDAQDMPAQEFDAWADGISVHVSAPAGALPADTVMTVTPIAAADVFDTVADAMDSEVGAVDAVDVVFIDPSGQEVEPALPIQVTMSHGDADTDETTVLRISDDGEASILGQSESASVTFDADEF